MPNFTDAVADAARTATCGILATNANLQNWWARQTDLPFTEALAAGAEGLRRGLCDNPDPVDPVPPQLNGAQCDDTTYRVEFDFEERVIETGALVRSGDAGLTGVGPFSTFSRANFAGVSQVGVRDGDGRETTRTAGNADNQMIITNTTTQVISGPDNCGIPAPDGPAPFVPGDTYIVPVSITYVDNSNTQITELGDFNLSLPIFLPGSVNIPVSIDFPDFTLNGNIDIEGNFTIELSPGRQPDDTVTDTEPPELPPGQEPVDPETERRIIGVHVFTTLPPSTSVTTIFQEDGPNIFAPRGGSVRFLVSGGGGASWTRDIDIKGDRQYIPCPAQQGAISVVANELPGGTVSLQRVYASIPSYLIPGT